MSKERMFCPMCGSQMPAGAKVCPTCGALVEEPQNEMVMAGNGSAGFEAEIVDERLSPGTLLNKGQYRVERVLGQGGFGITYECRDLILGRKVAIKEYFPANAYRDQKGTNNVLVTRSKYDAYQKGLKSFIEEGMKLSAFQDVKEIVSVFTAFEENKTAYIVMELLDGETLQNYIKRNGKLNYQKTLTIIEPVMTALEFVHSQGLIHRDVKPSNIMILNNGAVKLLDFGCAREANYDGRTMTSMYTQYYAPPEQKDDHGVQGPFTDVFSLCATIFDMMAGGIVTDVNKRFFFGALTASGAPKRAIEALKRGLDPNYKTRTQTIAELRREFCVYETENVRKEGAVSGNGSNPGNDNVFRSAEFRRAQPAAAQTGRSSSPAPKKKSPIRTILTALLTIFLTGAVCMFALITFGSNTNEAGTQETAAAEEDVAPAAQEKTEDNTQAKEEEAVPAAQEQMEDNTQEAAESQKGSKYITSLSELTQENWTQLYNACKDQEKALQTDVMLGNLRYREKGYSLKTLENLQYENAEFVTIRGSSRKFSNDYNYENYDNLLFVTFMADITDTQDNSATGAAGAMVFGNVMIDETGTLRFEKAFFSNVHETMTVMDSTVIGNYSNNYSRDKTVSLEEWNK